MYSEVRLLSFLPRWLLYINDTMSLTNPSIPIMDVGMLNGITKAPQQTWWFFTRSVVTTIYSLKLLSSISVKNNPEYINSLSRMRAYKNISQQIITLFRLDNLVCEFECVYMFLKAWLVQYIDKSLKCIII